MITLEDIKKNEDVQQLILGSQEELNALGYTEHSFRHIGIVSTLAGKILKEFGYSEREVELAEIAGYMHDIGNAINREDHAHTGAILAYEILKQRGMDMHEAAEIMMAIGNHDEKTGNAVSPISASIKAADIGLTAFPVFSS